MSHREYQLRKWIMGSLPESWRRRAKMLIRRFYPYYIIRMGRFSTFVSLYGLKKTIDLFRTERISRSERSLINDKISHLTQQMAREQRIPGSSINQGWLYHDYALPEQGYVSHRSNSDVRLKKIRLNIPLYQARILDIGCSSGGISLGLALLGARKVVGVDHDRVAINLARSVADKYRIDNVAFTVGSIESMSFNEVELIVWLSQWMWLVKSSGLEVAKDLLFDIPSKTGALHMFFESAANDGMAAIPGTTQTDIKHFLEYCSPFSTIVNLGPFEDKWRKKDQERMVFLCSDPVVSWTGIQGTVVRIDRNTVRKAYNSEFMWAKDIELECLQRLSGYPYFAKVIEHGSDWIKMSWQGNKIRSTFGLESLLDIVMLLQRHNIVHRDICPENLVVNNGILSLIDFGWALIDNRETPLLPPARLGRTYYEYGDWDDQRAATRILAKFKQKELLP